MCLIRKSVLLVSLIAFFLHADCADKYTDENRPYEFGFNIEGEQHRHEKKDENGIIMGEFGFITADGVYHVTVYATDENGNFKILSMKNIRVKPYPTAPAKKGHSLPFPPSDLQSPPPPPPSVAAPAKPVAASPARTCSSCSIPTTTTKAPQLSGIASVSNAGQYPNYNTASQPQSQNYPKQQNNPRGQNNPQQQNQPQNYGQGLKNPQQQNQNQNYPQGQNNPQQQNYLQGQNNPAQNNPQAQFGEPQSILDLGNRGGFDDGQNYPGISPSAGSNSPSLPQYGGQVSGERNPKQYKEINNPSGGISVGRNPKPMLVSAQMQIVDKNTDVYKLGPGEREGLPTGLNKEDMQQLLYTFNYTVGFHGHHEEGYRNGAKKGYYYVTGRNGVRTRVDYEADENGFRPKITEEVLDLLSEDVPKPETEKDEKYGLKGYEFKWLYFPTEQKSK